MRELGDLAAYQRDLQNEHKRGAEEALRRVFERAKETGNPMRAILNVADEMGVEL